MLSNEIADCKRSCKIDLKPIRDGAIANPEHGKRTAYDMRWQDRGFRAGVDPNILASQRRMDAHIMSRAASALGVGAISCALLSANELVLQVPLPSLSVLGYQRPAPHCARSHSASCGHVGSMQRESY